MSIPVSDAEIKEAKKASRYVILKYTTGSCLASAVPVPGTDIIADFFCMMNMLEDISKIFGLSAEQIEKLEPKKKIILGDIIAKMGNVMVGQVITQKALIALFKSMGKKVSAKAATRYIPLLGQAAAIVIAASIMWTIGEKHIKDCVKVANESAEQIGWQQQMAVG